MSISTNRDQRIDIVKGLGIFLMVAIHAGCVFLGFTSSFHMAIFFIASGYLYNNKYSDNIQSMGKFVFKKIKGLWLPYFLFSTLFVLLNNFFININVYTNNQMILQSESQYKVLSEYFSFADMAKKILNAGLFRTNTQLGGALWFFETLFIVVILYAIFDFLIRKITKSVKINLCIQLFISIAFSAVGYYLGLKQIYLSFCIERVFTVYILIFLGVLIKKYSWLEMIKKLNIIVKAVTAVLSGVAIYVYYAFFGGVSLSINITYNPVCFVIISFLGFIFLYVIADIICTYINRIAKVIAYFSIRAVPIIAVHFLAFKIVSVIGVVFFGMDSYLIASFPVLFTDGFWWIAYTIVGIGVPLLLDFPYIKLKSKIHNRSLNKK